MSNAIPTPGLTAVFYQNGIEVYRLHDVPARSARVSMRALEAHDSLIALLRTLHGLGRLIPPQTHSSAKEALVQNALVLAKQLIDMENDDDTTRG